MNHTVLKTSTQINPTHKVQNLIWHSSSAHKLANDEGNELPMKDGHIQRMTHSIL